MKKRSQCENVNEENDGNEDRLSDLLEGVLLHILSLFDTKQAVQSCILSTRWRHLWKRIPSSNS
ncbi:F-box protein [Medicago truncatula]|uniref:F-box protein n=1 Tax=Medicago truncatula TaxID=3880 RepID=G7JRS9_MEDTR|nr:F-box protein [Medicago truncatula]